MSNEPTTPKNSSLQGSFRDDDSGTTSSSKQITDSAQKYKGVTITSSGVKIDHREANTINKISGANLDTQHYYSKEETMAFSTHINNCMTDDALVARHFPLNIETEDIFQKLGDGLILSRLINMARPGTIDEKKINKQANMSIYQKQENLNTVIKAAKQIGAQTVNIGGQDIISGRPTLILGLLWQIIKIQLLSKVTVTEHPEVYLLKEENETDDFFAKLPPEEILLRWMNHHLKRAGETTEVKNFDRDMKDPTVFCKLLHQLDHSVCAMPYGSNELEVAKCAISGAQRLDVETFHKPQDICSGNNKLNMGFVAQIFNKCHGMEGEMAEAEKERLRLEAEEAERQRLLKQEAEAERIRLEEEEKSRLEAEAAENERLRLEAIAAAEEVERKKYTEVSFENTTCKAPCKVLTDVHSQQEKFTDLRKWFHMHPELSFKEVNTAKKVAEVLKSFGIAEIYEGVGQTGVVAVIRGGLGEGPCVALRADMDALPITEMNDVPYKSTNEGVMHACAHDGHMSELLAAAHVLNNLKESFKGSVKLIFQPAEEGYGGAREMIKVGVLEDGPFGPYVDSIYGIHLWAVEDLGNVLCSEGPMMAASDMFDITVHGRGGHGAAPQDAVDAIVEAAALITNLQTIVSRNVDPLEPAVITCGKISGGYNYNIIADKVHIQGTTRSMTTATQELIKTRMCECCSATAALFGGKIDIDYKYGYPATVNAYPAQVAIVRKAAEKLVGYERANLPYRTMGAEDFSYFLQNRPGCFFFVGSKLTGVSRPHHISIFDFDENAMMIASSVFVEIVKDVLNFK